MKKIGFIGVGGIGRPMAERLLDGGFELIVCDKREAALDVFRARGVRTTTEVIDCASADLVIFMVANDEQLKAAALGPRGLFDGVDPECPPAVAIMSTVLPQTAEDVAAALERKNIRTIDAPVSGGGVGAASGNLTIMVGGAEADLDVAMPVLAHLGRRIFHCGPLGSAEGIKVVNNMVGTAIVFLMAEATHLASALGIDLPRLIEVMDASSGQNDATRNYENRKAFYRFNTQTPELLKSVVDICRKDLGLATTLARQKGITAPMLEGVAQVSQRLSYEDVLRDWRSLAD